MIFRKKKQKDEEIRIQQRLSSLDQSVQRIQNLLTRQENRPEALPSQLDSQAIRKKQAELGQILAGVQHEISLIKKQLSASNEGTLEKNGVPFIYIQHLHVENVDMKEVDLSSNLGQLGIKELPGQLNIGQVYGKSKQSDSKHPKVFIQPKKD
ncbi:hypothetical protein [Metabacillus sp. 84]|uniref:hypothetical protein n=1 Tax=Metabacillus sp. 84 TaxID=3404705 RepID=UPI003CF6D198